MLKRWPAFTRFLGRWPDLPQQRRRARYAELPSEDGHGYSPVPIAAAIGAAFMLNLS